MEAFGRPMSVELNSPDFEQLAAGYGVGYRRVASVAQVGEALRDAIAGLSDRSTIVELQAELAVPPQSI